MFGIATKPRIYNLGDLFPGAAENGGGCVIYTTADKHHGLAVWLRAVSTSTTWNYEMANVDNTYTDNWGPWKLPTESQFDTYIRQMWNGLATDYLPWGQGFWPAKPLAKTSLGDSILLRDSVDGTYCRRYVVGTDTFADFGKATTTSDFRILVREF